MVFPYITYNSKAHRDEVNAKVFADARLQECAARRGCPLIPRGWRTADSETWSRLKPGRDVDIAYPTEDDLKQHLVVSHEEWVAARKKLLEKEKELKAGFT